MRRGGIRKRSRGRARKGTDWIATTGDQAIVLGPPPQTTLAEFLLITADELAEHGDNVLLHRLCGYVWAYGPVRAAGGPLTGGCFFNWGVRIAEQDATGLILPLDPDLPDDMDAGWLFLRSQPLGAFGDPAFAAMVCNVSPVVGSGGAHGTTGGPAIDINVKRKISGRQVLLLSCSVTTPLTWGNVAWIPPTDEDVVLIKLHLRALVSERT